MNSLNNQEESLKRLRTIALDLAARLDGLDLEGANSRELVLQLLGHLNLAALGLYPAPLKTSWSLIATLQTTLHEGRSRLQTNFPPPQKLIDDSAFASLTAPLHLPDGALKIDLAAILLASMRSQIKDRSNVETQTAMIMNDLATDILTIGWAAEWLTLNSSCGRDSVQKQTQIFTPGKIACFLAAETLKNHFEKTARSAAAPALTILDPACGAGHLLVAAGEAWLKANDFQSRERADQARLMRHLIAETLFGLDIDPLLTALAGLSTYLLVRRELPIADEAAAKIDLSLPLPQVYTVDAEGSLGLGLKKTYGRDLAHRQIDLGSALPGSFSCIVMNPPYQSARTMHDTTRDFLRKHYQQSSGDLYTAFIELGIRLLAPGGRLATIVQKSFLFIQRYRSLRLKLLENCRIKTIVDLGPGTFSSKPGEKVMSAVLVLEKKDGDTEPVGAISYGRDLDKTKQIEGRSALEIITNITGSPFALDCPVKLAELFKKLPAIGDYPNLFTVNGLFTCNNKRFIKHKNELMEEDLQTYVPYDKGGGKKWYHETELYLRWLDEGEEIRAYRHSRGQSRSLPGEEFYFQPGLTYSYIGTKGFKARLLSKGSIFDIASSAVFSKEVDLGFLLALFNSSLYIYLLSVLNPTINFQIGDIRRLPYKDPGDCEQGLAVLAAEAVELTRNWQADKTAGRRLKDNAIREREAAIQAEIDRLIFDLFDIPRSERSKIEASSWVSESRRNSLY